MAPKTEHGDAGPGERPWDDERSSWDAPSYMDMDQAVAWASGWNAAIEEQRRQRDV